MTDSTKIDTSTRVGRSARTWLLVSRGVAALLAALVLAMGAYLAFANFALRADLARVTDERNDLYDEFVANDHRICSPRSTPTLAWVLVADELGGPTRWVQFEGCALRKG